jgi:hypothetical protein
MTASPPEAGPDRGPISIQPEQQPTAIGHRPSTVLVAWLRRHWMIVGSVISGPVLTWLHGFTPWSISSLEPWFSQVALIRCGAHYSRALIEGVCPAAGWPAGQVIGNGWSLTAVGAAISRITGLSAEATWTILVAAIMALAVYGCLKLGARLGLGGLGRTAAAIFYFTSPSLFGMSFFGSTFWGMALIPAAVWAQLKAADWAVARRRWAPLIALGWGIGAYGLLVADGYAFVMAQFATGLVLLGRFRRAEVTAWVVRLILFVVATALSYLICRIHLPGVANAARADIGLFRSMGLDVATLVWPAQYQWWLDETLLIKGSDLWGDGTNAAFNYLGWILVALAVVGIVSAWRKRARQIWLWAGIGALALLLSFGPSLKVYAQSEPISGILTYEDYLMPEESALVPLPTRWLYEHVPGLTMMRATYRWSMLFRLSEALVGAYGIQVLARRGRRWRVAAVSLGALAVVELAPAVLAPTRAYRELDTRSQTALAMAQIDQLIVDPLDDALPDGAHVVIAPTNPEGNDFLAAYLATGANLRLFNVGGDKALAIAREAWPDEVYNLIFSLGDFPDLVAGALISGQADAVIVPRFATRPHDETWPPASSTIEQGDRAVARLSGDNRFTVADHEFFAVVTLAAPELPADSP